jgi:hypothetical protein
MANFDELYASGAYDISKDRRHGGGGRTGSKRRKGKKAVKRRGPRYKHTPPTPRREISDAMVACLKRLIDSSD